MYIMRRMAHVAGMAGVEHAVKMTKIVQDAGVPASMWVGGVGSVPGTVAWSVMVDSFAQWVGYSDKLIADSAYLAGASEGADLIVSMEADQLMQVIHGTIDTPSEVGTHLGSIEAIVQPGRGAEAAAFAVEVADAWTAVTGEPVVVVTNSAGAMGTIGWFTRHSDAASVDATEAKTAASADYAAVLAKGDELFTTGNRMFARRMA